MKHMSVLLVIAMVFVLTGCHQNEELVYYYKGIEYIEPGEYYSDSDLETKRINQNWCVPGNSETKSDKLYWGVESQTSGTPKYDCQIYTSPDLDMFIEMNPVGYDDFGTQLQKKDYDFPDYTKESSIEYITISKGETYKDGTWKAQVGKTLTLTDESDISIVTTDLIKATDNQLWKTNSRRITPSQCTCYSITIKYSSIGAEHFDRELVQLDNKFYLLEDTLIFFDSEEDMAQAIMRILPVSKSFANLIKQ